MLTRLHLHSVCMNSPKGSAMTARDARPCAEAPGGSPLGAEGFVRGLGHQCDFLRLLCRLELWAHPRVFLTEQEAWADDKPSWMASEGQDSRVN